MLMANQYSTKFLFTVLSIAFAGLFLKTQAQITVQGGIPVPTLVQNDLLSPGVIVSNIQYVGLPEQIGKFNGQNSNIGINSGIIISSGDIQNALGPNDAGSTGSNLGQPGDSDLDGLTNNATEDAAILSFDFVAYNDTVEFNYVFASEEYPEFVFSNYNDVFGFFITGPGYPNPTNIALIPNSSLPVTIDNVNDIVNSQYYIDNTTGTTVEFDGFTVKLKAMAIVQPCSTYTIKIAVADVGDDAYDSAVFLEAGSFNAGNSNFTISAGSIANINDSLIVEGCSNGLLQFLRNGDLSDTSVVSYTIGGNATNGVDYTQIPDSVVFYPGDTLITININALSDNINEGAENIIITLHPNNQICQNLPPQIVSIVINNFDPLQVAINPGALTIPSCTQAQFTASATGGYGNYTYTWDGGLPGTTAQTIYPHNPSNTYTVVVTDQCNNADTASITIDVVSQNPITATIAQNDTTYCPGGTPLTFNLSASAIGGQGQLTYSWSNGDSTAAITVTPTESTTYVVTVSDTCGNTVGVDSIMINIVCGVVVPNVFTPNGDGQNDTFVIANLDQFPGSALVIYNRWGRRIYSSDDYKNDWDGDNHSEGVYYYTLDIKENQQKLHGTVTLLK